MTNEHILRIAEVCYNVNSAYSCAIGEIDEAKTWKDAQQWEIDATLYGIQRIIDDPETTPEEFHDNWMTEKLEQGWIYGPIKSAEQKTHPNLVSYQTLSQEVKAKDFILQALMKTRIKQALSEAIINPTPGPIGPPGFPGPPGPAGEPKAECHYERPPKETTFSDEQKLEFDRLFDQFSNLFNDLFKR